MILSFSAPKIVVIYKYFFVLDAGRVSIYEIEYQPDQLLKSR